jgi:dephospho-CoA kinase
MFILGLTGSIGMGKSTTAAMFRKFGVPVHDADAAVHRLYSGKAAPLIEAAFPGVVRDGVVDRAMLAPLVLGKPEAMERLEAIVHPLVRAEEQTFLRTAAASRHRLVVLDIPLLFETGGQGRVDAVVVVSAPVDVQRQRVMARPGMTEERFANILKKQMPDAEKRRLAHFVVDSGQGLSRAEAAVRDILVALAAANGKTRDSDKPDA